MAIRKLIAFSGYSTDKQWMVDCGLFIAWYPNILSSLGTTEEAKKKPE